LKAAHAAPEIKLPTAQADFCLVLATDLLAARGAKIGRHARSSPLAADTDYREALAALDAERRTGLFDPQNGRAQVAVVGQRGFDQALQNGVGEIRAPGLAPCGE